MSEKSESEMSAEAAMTRREAETLTDMGYWFPKIEAAGLPVPETRILHTDCELLDMLDGESPEGLAFFLLDLRKTVESIGVPCFLRTGQTSGKHDWSKTCYVASGDGLVQHVFNLVEYSACADIFGLSVATWVVRALIPTKPLFTAFPGDMPITREFRVFVREGTVERIQPYWPQDALEGHVSSEPQWRTLLRDASRLSDGEVVCLSELARVANQAVPGYWSVDFLQDADGAWWLTDMAEGSISFKWSPS